jgi:uncharacterized protein YcaQ
MSGRRFPPPGTSIDLSLEDARRIALGAQGFDRPRPGRPVGVGHIGDVIRRLGLLQLDFVNVLVPSHYLVVFSRLGAYQRPRLDEAVYRRREFTEQWAHEASIIPMETWPLLRYRMETHRTRPWGFDQIMRRHRVYVDTALGEIQTRGPLSASDLPDPMHTGRRLPGSWYGSVPRAVLEACFGRGQLAVTARHDTFARVFDLADRVIPPEPFGRRLTLEHSLRELLKQAARSHGIGTAADLADYYRMPVRDARPRIEELVATGDLREARVEGWREPAYLSREARLPGGINARALLSPFDPVIWFRQRTRRLFQFDYRFEIFVPQPKRKWGAYVLPFLLGDRLVARVDLKADRPGKTLLVQGAYLEPKADADAVVPALSAELLTLASWLALDRVTVGRRGNLARALRAALQK